ncbi:MAG: universal stress protein [Rudanella sp.]|nr:universal stress protein [Rudanella sp.]
MKTIILATDFSPMANQAAMFANQLAHDQKASLILLHIYQGWATDPARTDDVFRSEDTVRANSEEALQRLADTLGEGGMAVPIRCIAHEGSVKATLRLVSQSEGADLLMMSTVGSTPRTAQIMGSVASELIAETEIPLLLIPPGVTYGGLKNVVLCINLAAPPDTIAFGRALGFSRSFGSVINVLCVSYNMDDADTHEQAKQIRQLLIQQPHTFTINAGEGEIHDTLLNFAHDSKANLIMMLPQMRNWFWKLFSEGETQRMARLTDIPLLAVV